MKVLNLDIESKKLEKLSNQRLLTELSRSQVNKETPEELAKEYSERDL